MLLNDNDDGIDNHSYQFSFHHGATDTFPSLLQSSNLIFCYSTAWETSGFDTNMSAMVLSQEWNKRFLYVSTWYYRGDY